MNNYGGNNSPYDRGYAAGRTTRPDHALCNCYRSDLDQDVAVGLSGAGRRRRYAWRGGLAHYSPPLRVARRACSLQQDSQRHAVAVSHDENPTNDG